MSSADLTYVQPIPPTDGRLGYLTRDQAHILKLFWTHLLNIFDGLLPFDQTVPPLLKGQAQQEDTPETIAAASALQRSSWFGRLLTPVSTGSVATPRFTGRELELIFWKLTQMDHPDIIILKFIRARKWVIEDALKMFVNALKWRIVERVDELLELPELELDSKYPAFIEQMRMGKGYIHGADPLGRPVAYIHTNRHHKADQPPETLHRFTLFTMECGRTVLPPGTETVIVLFDLTNFGLANMDWSFVRLFVQCFESYYPETLGVCIVHGAPTVFWNIWKLILSLLDPVVAAKIIFTQSNSELHRVIPRERLPVVPYDGLDDWTYQYTPASAAEKEQENLLLMKDSVQKEELMKQRQELEARFTAATRNWTKMSTDHPDSESDGRQELELLAERDGIAKEMREHYQRASPYIRAGNLYQRWGVTAHGQVNWTYNLRTEN